MAAPKYDESSVKVLKGLDPVRHRPGMYTRTDNPLHICQEVIDNAADEALAGFADRIEVMLWRNQTLQVIDNGRGIPVGIHPEEGVPTVQVVFTQLHAGGKFDKGSYKVSGGLHGVGSSVVNALSTQLDVKVYKNGHIHFQEYKRGVVVADLAVIGETEKHGTTVHFTPDPTIFTETTEFDFQKLEEEISKWQSPN